MQQVRRSVKRYTGDMPKISHVLNDELFMLIGRLHAESPDADCALIRKASELYALAHSLPTVKGSALAQRRRKLDLTQEQMANLCRVSHLKVANWEKDEAPAWVGPMLSTLEERRRDEERRDYLGINENPEP